MRNNQSNTLVALGLVSLLGVAGLLWFFPTYGVWRQGMDGRAKLAEAEYSRQIAVLEAQAKMDSASKLAESEVIRAEGVANANKIIGDSLKGKDGYLQYLWITEGEKNTNRTVYMVPSNGGAPVPTFSVGELAEQPPAPRK